MLSIVYASAAVRLLSESEIVELLEVSQANNAREGVTGMLLYNDGNFIQVIEGPDTAVLDLYDKISRDGRHQNIVLLGKDPITERQFPKWSMGFRDVKRLSPAEQTKFNEFLRDEFMPAFFESKPTRAYVMLLSFKETIR